MATFAVATIQLDDERHHTVQNAGVTQRPAIDRAKAQIFDKTGDNGLISLMIAYVVDVTPGLSLRVNRFQQGLPEVGLEGSHYARAM